MLRLGQILEAVGTEILDLRFGEQAARLLGEEYLPSVARLGDACGSVDVETDVAVLSENRLAGVDSHAHPHAGAFRPLVRGQPALSLDRGGQRVPRLLKGDEELVAA